MKDLMFWGMFIACLLISAMTFYIMYSQAMVNRDLERKYYDLKQEISRVLVGKNMTGRIILGIMLAKLKDF